MEDKDLQAVLMELVRGQARTDVGLSDVKHDIKNFQQVIETFMPRREIDLKSQANEKAHDNFDKRIDKLESKGAKWFGPVAGMAGSFIVGIILFCLRYYAGIG